MTRLAAEHARLLEDLRPWIVAAAPARDRLAPAPLGVAVAPGEVFDPLNVRSAPFLRRLERLDELVYGPLGLTLPRWAFFDCAEMPGVVLGLGAPAGALPRHVRDLFGGDDDALVPLSMCIAVPTLEAGHWVAYTLASLDEVSPGACRPGTRALTLELALAATGASRITTTTQWTSVKLATHARHAPLEVIAAWLPAHDEPSSAVFRYSPHPTAAPPPATERVDAFDRAALEDLQSRIEAGACVSVVAPPTRHPDRVEVPLRVTPCHAWDDFEATDDSLPAVARDPHPLDVDGLLPFVVATRENLPHLELAPLGRSIAPEDRLDPLGHRSVRFLRLLERLDRVAFGPEGMPMPRWLFFDGAELPGAIVGLGATAASLPASARALLEVPASYGGLVPLAMYIALPTVEDGGWFGHNLASVGRRVEGAPLRGLGSRAKAVALAALRCRVQLGATQWDASALHVHTRMGPLELLSAWTPAHAEPWTLTYRVEVDAAVLDRLAAVARPAASDRAPTRWVRSDDHAAMRALQAELEAGARAWVVGRPEPLDGGVQRVPVAVAP